MVQPFVSWGEGQSDLWMILPNILKTIWWMDGWMDGWVRVLRPFNSISVISRLWKGERERLCAMKCRLGSGRISLQRDSNPWPREPKSGALTARHYLMNECHTWYNGSVWHKDWPHKIYVGQWPIFHGQVILPYILKTIWWMKVTLDIMDQCDTKIDHIKYV